VNGLFALWDKSGVQEFTIEANPDDVTPEWCAALCDLGVNRVSMGVQSMDDSVLRFMGRRHNAAQVVQAVKTLRDAGITNISIDLMYGVPGQTVETWRDTVRQALALEVQHISAYCLSYEVNTRLWHARECGEVTEVPEDDCIAMYRDLTQMLRDAGYEHYEISNFALPGYYSRHNSSYWNETPYLGLGAAAHSYDGRVRRANPPSMNQYVKAIEAGVKACDEEVVHNWERLDERVMLGLRTSSGVDSEKLRQDFGEKVWKRFVSQAQPHLQSGLLRCEDDRYILTPQGVLLSDMVIRDLMSDV